MKLSLKHIFFLLLPFAMLSCIEEVEGPAFQEGEEGVIGLKLNAVPLSAGLGTKALPDGLAEENLIKDVWIVQYDKATGGMIGTPKYYEASELAPTEEEPNPSIAVILPGEGQVYRFVAIANTGQDEQEPLGKALAKATTLAILTDMFLSSTSLEGSYTTTEDGKSRLLMSGVTDITKDSDVLNFDLYRNVAKLTLTITNANGSGVTIKSVKLRSIPDRIHYADRLLDYSVQAAENTLSFYTDNPSPKFEGVSFIDYPLENCNIVEPAAGSASETVTYEYYIPRNCRGIASLPNDTHTKNKYAPSGATYVEIIAERTDSGSPVRYRLYLGENMTNDFNIMPNHHYTLPVSITSVGSVSDSRVEDLGNVSLSESNSYIINPIPGSVIQPVSSIPAAERSNRYWDLVKGGSNGTITADTEWIAEVIWQDQPRRLITFCNSTGGEECDVLECKGFDKIYFKPVGDGNSTIEGNVLIGIRKKNSGYNEYLWSWHIWLTDYNPDEIGDDPWNGNYKYTVQGGEVHRYDDNGVNVWSSTYSGRWIMDRNLGALSNKLEEGTNSLYKARGLAYQFGRKDPFAMYNTADSQTAVKLYDIEGQSILGEEMYTGLSSLYPNATYNETDNVIKLRNQSSISNAIHTPQIFYAVSGDWASYDDVPADREDWIFNNTSLIWNNPPAYKRQIEEEKGVTVTKSLFDPCPLGWEIPQNGTWHILKDKNTERDYNFYISLTYETGSPTAFYPLAGYRTETNGEISGGYGCYWTSNPYAQTMGLYFWFDRTRMSVGTSGIRSYGNSVRCIQEKLQL